MEKEKEYPRCSGCGTRDHGANEVCPNRPDEEPDWMDDSWGDYEAGDFS